MTESPACNRQPRWLETCVRRWPSFSARYLSLDPRTLGLARIYVGSLLFIELLRRAAVLPTWYTNEGPLPNHVLMWRPMADQQFSLFYLASNRAEATVLFVACGVVFLLFTVGYRTRLFHALSLLAICSLHNRLILFEDGAEVTTRLLTFWTLFLPMGARYSIDALRTGKPAEERPSVSLAVPAILLQIAIIYTFNVLHKTGETWRDGTVVHYVLHQDRIITWLGLQLRPYVDLTASKILTYAAFATEAVLPPLVLTPVFWKPARRLAIALAIGLHLGFAALLNLGMFSFNMIGFFLLLLTDRDWYWIGRLPLASAVARVRATTLRALRALSLDGPPPPKSPLRERVSRWAPGAREATVVLFMLALGGQALLENRAVPRALRVKELPLVLRMLVVYPRLFEGWSMFAPDAPKHDAFMYVDAITASGRHVDPINEEASRIAKLPVRAIPEQLGQEDNWCDYLMNVIPHDVYHGTLADYIRSYPKRTGRKEDRIVSFKVWIMEDESPAPGQTKPTNVTQYVLFEEK